ncbi:FkbM family methyltransferase [Oscillibacter sp. 1-3]|nr:FkbM family methyltransferase [Oscillibacter sp. 1-3]
MCDDGEIVVPVATIDEIVEKENPKVTMIKMDIEGSELEALKGAKKTIQRNKPKLAICIYHKPEDMLEIPLYIKSLVPEYKLYVRHHSNSNVETVLYAVRP